MQLKFIFPFVINSYMCFLDVFAIYPKFVIFGLVDSQCWLCCFIPP